ncbi:MAG: T9SS type A sorting domain-containing protein [Sphingobacteriales bacterium]|nr:MAG: T9SS type A sorting domain-containing protein [Sphingobacteriales bacterium]
MIYAFNHIYRCVVLLILVGAANTSYAQSISEDFANISTLSTSGWVRTNNSSPTGTTGWFQGNTSVFTSQSGASNAYIAADENNATGSGTISNWLISPNRTFKNGDVITFYTRTRALTLKPDRLQVRMSTNGTSSNVGTTASSVGDFTDLLLDINSAQILLVYPGAWTQYSITIGGLTAPTSGRIAFRYYVTSGGSAASNSDYIGIDEFEYTPYTCPTITLSPASLNNGTPGIAYSQAVSQSPLSGPTTFAVSSGSVPPGLTLSTSGTLSGTPTTLGTYTFTIRATHTATACTGTKSYTVNISCPVITINPATLPDGSTGNAYSQTITQSGGTAPVNFTIPTGSLPPGLSLSASGLLSGTPTAGGSYSFSIKATSTVTGCSGMRAYTIDIDCGAGLAALADFTPLCANSAPYTLTGGTPAGGTYSGTGVSNGIFNPSVGTQIITYTYQDALGCSSTATATLTVNDTPNITITQIGTVCRAGAAFTLTNASPAGGIYSGAGVSNNMFSPIADNQTILYTYTDSKGCTSSEDFDIIVDDGPTVSFDELPALMCLNSFSLSLTGGNPAGGRFAGRSVKNSVFTPDSLGMNPVTYIYPSTTGGCDGTYTQYVEVIQCPLDVVHLNTESNSVICYPTPSTGIVTIDIAGIETETAAVILYDMRGVTIMNMYQSHSATYNLTAYPKGVYHLKVVIGSRQYFKKIILL